MDKSSRGRLSRYIRTAMEHKGLKLRDIEERSGGQITDGYVADILSGRSDNPSAAKIKALARALDLDPHALFDVVCGPFPERADVRPNDPLDIGLFLSMMREVAESPDMVRVVEALLQLAPPERVTVLRYVESVNRIKREPRGVREQHRVKG
jgi:transcriptional regulator with XRE-family HTH domain